MLVSPTVNSAEKESLHLQHFVLIGRPTGTCRCGESGGRSCLGNPRVFYEELDHKKLFSSSLHLEFQLGSVPAADSFQWRKGQDGHSSLEVEIDN